MAARDQGLQRTGIQPDRTQLLAAVAHKITQSSLVQVIGRLILHLSEPRPGVHVGHDILALMLGLAKPAAHQDERNDRSDSCQARYAGDRESSHD